MASTKLALGASDKKISVEGSLFRHYLNTFYRVLQSVSAPIRNFGVALFGAHWIGAVHQSKAGVYQFDAASSITQKKNSKLKIF